LRDSVSSAASVFARGGDSAATNPSSRGVLAAARGGAPFVSAYASIGRGAALCSRLHPYRLARPFSLPADSQSSWRGIGGRGQIVRYVESPPVGVDSSGLYPISRLEHRVKQSGVEIPAILITNFHYRYSEVSSHFLLNLTSIDPSLSTPSVFL
jgi:hypothetical protein